MSREHNSHRQTDLVASRASTTSKPIMSRKHRRDLSTWDTKLAGTVNFVKEYRLVHGQNEVKAKSSQSNLGFVTKAVQNTCTIPECGRDRVKGSDLCPFHDGEQKRKNIMQSLLDEQTETIGEEDILEVKKENNEGVSCNVPNCDQQSHRIGLCSFHYQLKTIKQNRSKRDHDK
jgi:hypothetical protein